MQNLRVTFTPADRDRYEQVTASASLTVNKATLQIIAEDKARPEGARNPRLTAQYLGFVNGDTGDNLDVPVSLATAAVRGSAPGAYPIVASGAADGNYRIRFVDGTLTVRAKIPTGRPELRVERKGNVPNLLWKAFPGFELYWSADLVSWTAVGDVATEIDGESVVSIVLSRQITRTPMRYFRLQQTGNP